MGLITCPDCGKRDVSDRAPTCPQCGRPFTEAELASRRAARDAPRTSVGKWVLGAIGVLVLIQVLFSTAGEGTPDKPSLLGATSAAELADPKTDTAWARGVAARTDSASIADVLLAENRLHSSTGSEPHEALHRRAMAVLLDSVPRLLDRKQAGAWNPGYAQTLLLQVREPLTSNQRQKAERLRAQTSRILEEQNAEARLAALKITTEQRRRYARELESSLLDKNLNVTVSTHGEHATTLRLEFILVNKVWAHKFSREGSALETMRRLGFTKFILTDGYDEEWTWDLR